MRNPVPTSPRRRSQASRAGAEAARGGGPRLETPEMGPSGLDEAEVLSACRDQAVQRHLRGSGVLFFGRLLSKWLNFAVQILIVRLLSQGDYGAFAYALSVVALLQQAATFGLDQSITRFIPMYQEQRDYAKLFGTLFMSLAIVGLLGGALVTALQVGHTLLGQFVIQNDLALELLLLLAFLVPIQAIDNLFVGLFAVFTNPAAIFFRRYLLAPGLRLGVLLLMLLTGYGVLFAATGYLVADLVGLMVGAAILWHFFRRQGLLHHFERRRIELPWREVLGYTFPLFLAEIVLVALPAMEVVLLERFADVTQVAAYLAVIPLAFMIDLVKSSFAPLFMPAATRMLARGDVQGVNHLYWQSAIWIAILAAPAFLLTFAGARPLIELLYGPRYASSAEVLSVLSLGWYVQISMGFNASVLKVYGRLGFVLLVNAVTLSLSMVLGLVLIPHYGALGAAIASAVAWTAHGLLNQVGLLRGTEIRIFEPHYASAYIVIGLSALALWLVEVLLRPPGFVSLTLTAVTALGVFRVNRRMLQMDQVFPELLRIPVLGHFLRP